MKIGKWITLILFALICGCKKETISDITEATLNQKWQVYVVAIVAISDMNNQNACLYTTRVSDLYYDPIPSRCDIDDVYDFTRLDSVKINYGTKRCLWDQPESVMMHYERKGDSLLLNGLIT